MHTRLEFSLRLFLLNQSGSGRQNGGKCEKQSADLRTKMFGNNSSQSCHRSAEAKTNGVLIPFRFLHIGCANFDSHASPISAYQRPKAQANHTMITKAVVCSAGSLRRIKRKLTTTA